MECKCWKHQRDTEDYDAVEQANRNKERQFTDTLCDQLHDLGLEDDDHEARLALIRKLYWSVFGTRLLTRVLGLREK